MKKYNLPLYIDRGWQSFGCIGAPLSGGRHDGFTFWLELVYKVVHLFPFGAQFKCFAWSAGSCVGIKNKQRTNFQSFYFNFVVVKMTESHRVPWVLPDWSRGDLGLLRFNNWVCDDRSWGDAAHASTTKAAKCGDLLPRSFGVSSRLLQLLRLPSHLRLGLSFLSLWVKTISSKLDGGNLLHWLPHMRRIPTSPTPIFTYVIHWSSECSVLNSLFVTS